MKSLNIEEIKKGLRERVVDFAKKVAPVYKIMNLTWSHEIPDEDGIAATLYDLIDDVHEIDLYAEIPSLRISSGRLSVGYEVVKTSKNGFITGIEIFIDFNYNDSSFDDFKNYLIEWKKK